MHLHCMSPISKVLCLYFSRNVSFNTNLKFTRTYYFSLWSRGPCPSTLLCLSHASLVGKGQLTHSASSISRISFHPQLHFNFYFNFQLSFSIFNCKGQLTHSGSFISRISFQSQMHFQSHMMADVCGYLEMLLIIWGSNKKPFFFGQISSKVLPPPPFWSSFRSLTLKSLFFMTSYAAKVFPKEDNTSTQLGARQIPAQ